MTTKPAALNPPDNWVWCDDWERPAVFPPANSALHRYWCNPECLGPHRALLIGLEIDNGYNASRSCPEGVDRGCDDESCAVTSYGYRHKEQS